MLTPDLLHRLQTLSGLRLSAGEEAQLAPQLERVLTLMEALGVGSPPEAGGAADGVPLLPHRADEPGPGLPADLAVGAAPSSDAGLFRVAPVLPTEEP